MNFFLRYFTWLSLLLSCSSNIEDSIETITNIATPSKPNILLIIADDFGLDACPGYPIGNSKPNMPNLEKLMTNGIKFNNVWSNPTCSPTRAGILTGKYGFRTGVIKVDDPLSTSEISIQKYLDQHTNNEYNHAVIGKWHLSRSATHPNDLGINYFAGISRGGVPSYTNWVLNTNGNLISSSEYTTSKLTNLAIDWIATQNKPWFLWLAYNAPHTPFHLPPNNLHTQANLPLDQTSIDTNPLPYYFAAVEAMDTELGRLMSTWTKEQKDNTIIIFIGDNGTPTRVSQEYSFRTTKGTIYQGGINVPMIVSGKGVSRINDTENALINTTDLFATIADIANTGTTEINDSKSFKPLLSDTNATKRNYIYSEKGNNDGTSDITVRNATHKYILFGDGYEALYNLEENPFENPNLLDTSPSPLSDTDQNIKNDLVSSLNSLKD